MTELKPLVEAIIFASSQPLKIKELASFFEKNEDEIEKVVNELKKEYESQSRGLRIVEVAGGMQMVTSPDCAPVLREYFKIQKKIRLSRPGLETLAIIAYNQPITRPEIDNLRGVNSEGVLKTLLDKRLIEISGRKEEPGKPLLYRTTDEFLKVFGLKDLKDMPTLKELEEMIETEEESETQEPQEQKIFNL
ncbi:MAG: SMC-Scp complex subunit ScpB [Candidatus Hydrogenedentota bacterium]